MSEVLSGVILGGAAIRGEDYGHKKTGAVAGLYLTGFVSVA